MPALLSSHFARLESCSALRWRGRVTQVIGQLVESEGPFCSVGELCHVINSNGRIFPGEIVGFRGATVLSMPLERPDGIRYGDAVMTWGARPMLRAGSGLLGRVIDGMGEPLDSLGAYSGVDFQTLDAAAPLALDRELIRECEKAGIPGISCSWRLWL